MTEELSFYQRVAKLQQDIKVAKTQWNDFGKYWYRNAESILNTVKPMLKDNKLSMELLDELVYIGERYYLKTTVNIYDLNDREKVVTTFGYARECQSKPKMSEEMATGSASTFSHKYALQNMFLLDDSTDDPDTHDNSKKPAEQSKQAKPTANLKPAAKINQAQLDRILKAVDQTSKGNKDEGQRLIKSICDKVKVDHLADIWQSWFDGIINKLEGQVK